MKVFLIGTAGTQMGQVAKICARALHLRDRQRCSAHETFFHHALLSQTIPKSQAVKELAKSSVVLEQCFQSIWFAKELAQELPNAIFIGVRRSVDSIVDELMENESAKLWLRKWRKHKIKWPNTLLGCHDERTYRGMSIEQRMRARASSHMLELDNIGAVIPSSRLLLIEYSDIESWEEEIRGFLEKHKPIPREPLPIEEELTPKPTPKLVTDPTPKPAVDPTPTLVTDPTPKLVTDPTPRRSLRLKERQESEAEIVSPPEEPAEPAEPKSPYPDCTFYWINLDRAKNRRQQMQSDFSDRNIPHKRIVAFDGTKFNLNGWIPKNWSARDRHKHRLEAATTLSHLKALHTFVQDGGPFAIICEDDLSWEYEPKWAKPLRETIEEAPKIWKILQLGIIMDKRDEWARMRQQNKSYIPRKRYWWSAICYAIKRKTAISILEKHGCDINAPFKATLNATVRLCQSEKVIMNSQGSTAFLVYPPPFTYPLKNDSYIHKNHLALHSRAKRFTDNIWRDMAK